ncbi:YoaK family protein [Streptococcus moroccensis]|uniref:Uncharacterized membrane protein YoaK (UPF0700 family) n=1 Tax=Streptococcus moroccensis TaxID=1451356 RepID=A0ABT9YU10_9STRE|nr:YoaK family protein [Streptococcus moroccensis]MDQ0223482.1 uncharacterized membrane protein YoaK (UPF0700 family) [Streptococcus moroccensis]
MTKKSYRLYEGLRVATLLTFVSGYIDAFTFHTQGKRFAAVQTGNLIYFALAIADQHWVRVLDYAVPLLVFSFGQWLNYAIRQKIMASPLRWHAFSSKMMLAILTLTVLFTHHLPPVLTIIGLSLFASIQVDTFKRLRGAPYGNVMMTGNIKNAAHLMGKGIMEGNPRLRHEALLIYSVMFSFVIGIITSSYLTKQFGETALAFALLPVILLNYWLGNEKTQTL